MQQKTFNFFYAFLLALLGVGATLVAEDITLTTYYPAPYGVYEELTTTGNTYLATTSGKNVGIGLATTDTIQNKLDVEGNVAIGASYSGTNAAPENGLIVQGQVGIGTAIPTVGAALDVSGTLYATAYYVGTSAGASGTFMSADGKTVTVTKGIITGITP
jgi:hypothetical protein